MYDMWRYEIYIIYMEVYYPDIWVNVINWTMLNCSELCS